MNGRGVKSKRYEDLGLKNRWKFRYMEGRKPALVPVVEAGAEASPVQAVAEPLPVTAVPVAPAPVQPRILPSASRPEPIATPSGGSGAGPVAPAAPPEVRPAFAQALATVVTPQATFAQKQAVWRQLRDAGQLDSAITELTQRVANDPRSAEDVAALGQAYWQKCGQLKDLREQAILAMKADQTFDAALNLDPNHWEARFSKALAMSYWPAEITPVPLRVLTNFVATAAIFNHLGEKHARHGRWLEAITNFSKLIVIVPTDFRGYHGLAPLLALAGEPAGYRGLGEGMLGRFAGTSDPEVAVAPAEDGLLLPPTNQFEALGRLIEQAEGVSSNEAFRAVVLCAKGLGEYRRGRYKEAMTWTKAALACKDTDSWVEVKSRLVLAMAQQRLGREEDARSRLADATEQISRKMPSLEDGLGDHWRDWVAVRVLLREAKTTIHE